MPAEQPVGLPRKNALSLLRCAGSGEGVLSAGPLSSFDSFPQSSYCRWTTNQYTDYCKLAATRVYYSISSSGEGAEGVNYNQTIFGYDFLNRRNRVVSPGGTITRTIFDSLLRVSHLNRLLNQLICGALCGDFAIAVDDKYVSGCRQVKLVVPRDANIRQVIEMGMTVIQCLKRVKSVTLTITASATVVAIQVLATHCEFSFGETSIVNRPVVDRPVTRKMSQRLFDNNHELVRSRSHVGRQLHCYLSITINQMQWFRSPSFHRPSVLAHRSLRYHLF
jgi:hypothetical protein